MITRRGGGRWTVRNAFASVTMPDAPRSEAPAQFLGQRVGVVALVFNYEAQVAGGEVGDHDRRLALLPRRVEALEEVELHGLRLGGWCIFM